MTLVIEESEDISLEMLSPILDTLRKDNEVKLFSIFFSIFCLTLAHFRGFAAFCSLGNSAYS